MLYFSKLYVRMLFGTYEFLNKIENPLMPAERKHAGCRLLCFHSLYPVREVPFLFMCSTKVSFPVSLHYFMLADINHSGMDYDLYDYFARTG